ncbi:hypothetical protein [uncultured Muribaculum sp.]|jgi:hypothetical protein|uniref:hypothetical protein n=1 Tax=uncultured Muribaculum sp. TaxID=1918613 RepID=UPI0025A9CFE9|nr:hypothetical protein [uncultured Muribaculum sp.]
MIKLLGQTRRADITFRRNGQISITARVSRILKIVPGDSINIAYDNGEYLLFATHHANSIGRYMARCYPSKKSGNNYCANSIKLCRAMLSVVNTTAEKVAFMVGEEIVRGGIVYIPIITAHPL